MILIDTSVWIDFFRGKNQKLVNQVSHLLDDDQVVIAAPIRLELLTGASKKEALVLKGLLAALPCFYPDVSHWQQLEEWAEIAAGHGYRFGAMDLLIAAAVSSQDDMIWSHDKDFLYMEKLGWIRNYSGLA